MPDPDPNVVVVVPAPLDSPPPGVVTPPEGFASWCEWARKGLADALDGMRKAGSGVSEYHVGTRGLHRSGPADQIKNVDYWNEMVKFYCGVDSALPSSLTGRDTAFRVICRDL
jgi:hypothetical protein